MGSLFLGNKALRTYKIGICIKGTEAMQPSKNQLITPHKNGAQEVSFFLCPLFLTKKAETADDYAGNVPGLESPYSSIALLTSVSAA